MLEIRPICENCGKALPNDSPEAMICSFECTFCKDCMDDILHNVCPNCGGGFVPRPVRPREKLAKYPASTEKKFKPIDTEAFNTLLARYRDVAPGER